MVSKHQLSASFILQTPKPGKKMIQTLGWWHAASTHLSMLMRKIAYPGVSRRIWLNVGETWRVKIRDLSRKKRQMSVISRENPWISFSNIFILFIPPPNLNISAKFGFRPFSLFLPAGMDCAGMDLDTLVAEHGLTREEAAEVVRRLKAAPLAPWLLTRCFFHLKRDSNIYIYKSNNKYVYTKHIISNLKRVNS